MRNRSAHKIKISDHLIAQLSEFISENLGLYFPEKRRDEFYDKFYLAAAEYGFSDPEACIHWLLSAPLSQEQIEILSSYLTIGETHFYRDNHIYEGLENYILPELIKTRREQGKYLRIWSAGCSSGEEPYSIAILLYKMIPDIKNWNISILATDINPRALEKAKKGIYKKWSFRSTPEWVRDGYFINNQDGSFTIKPCIMDMVSFSYHNLAKDPFPSMVNNISALDIIFCRNVIMYFQPKLSHRIINQFYRSLLDGGCLIVSGSEGPMTRTTRFVTDVLPDTIFYRKDLSKSGTIETFPVKTAGYVYHKVIHDDSGIFPGGTTYFPEYPFPVRPDAKTGTPQEKPVITEIIEIKPDPVRESALLYDQGNYPEAEAILTKYLLHDQKNPEAMLLLAKIFSNQGKFNEATELCRKGIEIDKCNPSCYYLLALIFQEQGKIEEAIFSLHSSIYLDNDHVLSYYTLGNILFQQGDMNKSGKYFNNALSLLDKCDKEIILPGSDGLSSGRLTEIIKMKNLPDNSSIKIK
jgi:chemotaxis protein methyltransferase CheR